MADARNWLKYVALGCSGALVLVVLFAIAIFLFVGRLTAAPEQVTRDFLAAAARGDAAAAHGYFSAPLKERQPLDALADSLRTSPTLFDVVDVSFANREVDLSGARLSGTATLRAGTRIPVSFRLAREGDHWRLLAYELGTDDESSRKDPLP